MSQKQNSQESAENECSRLFPLSKLDVHPDLPFGRNAAAVVGCQCLCGLKMRPLQNLLPSMTLKRFLPLNHGLLTAYSLVLCHIPWLTSTFCQCPESWNWSALTVLASTAVTCKSGVNAPGAAPTLGRWKPLDKRSYLGEQLEGKRNLNAFWEALQH
jgi:hypothetical protein